MTNSRFAVLIAALGMGVSIGLAIIFGLADKVESTAKNRAETIRLEKVTEDAKLEKIKQLEDLTYKEVCIDGVVYIASQVITYSGQFGISNQFWVVGPAKTLMGTRVVGC